MALNNSFKTGLSVSEENKFTIILVISPILIFIANGLGFADMVIVFLTGSFSVVGKHGTGLFLHLTQCLVHSECSLISCGFDLIKQTNTNLTAKVMEF